LRSTRLSAPDQARPDAEASRRERLGRLRSALRGSAASDRERAILGNRYQLHGEDKLTYRELGERFGVSGERVRQLEKRGLKRLRRALAG